MSRKKDDVLDSGLCFKFVPMHQRTKTHYPELCKFLTNHLKMETGFVRCGANLIARVTMSNSYFAVVLVHQRSMMQRTETQRIRRFFSCQIMPAMLSLTPSVRKRNRRLERAMHFDEIQVHTVTAHLVFPCYHVYGATTLSSAGTRPRPLPYGIFRTRDRRDYGCFGTKTPQCCI